MCASDVPNPDGNRGQNVNPYHIYVPPESGEAYFDNIIYGNN